MLDILLQWKKQHYKNYIICNYKLFSLSLYPKTLFWYRVPPQMQDLALVKLEMRTASATKKLPRHGKNTRNFRWYFYNQGVKISEPKRK